MELRGCTVLLSTFPVRSGTFLIRATYCMVNPIPLSSYQPIVERQFHDLAHARRRY